MKWLESITDSMDLSLSKLREIVKDREAWQFCSPWGCKELDMTERIHFHFQERSKSQISKTRS